MGIDRQQRIRGFGLLADVSRFKPALQAAQKWPWEANLAFAQYEVQWWNTRAKQDAAAQATKAKRIDVWNGEVLSQFGNMSSPTILFILERLRALNAPRPYVALGFGPGLAAEAALFV